MAYIEQSRREQEMMDLEHALTDAETMANTVRIIQMYQQ